MATPREALERTFGKRMIRRSLAVAVVVGTILNAINQGPELLDGHPPVVWKLMLTYLVPFLVASFGSYSALRSE
ncbi:MAG: nitrate/nitrite transporter NrtS [Novosphingobium sp.]|nr:nitrate/nitrite transporter NrtS [Novosphingobium sp.]MCP5403361.1 nitrate/nitrite transporter NrtS [Novosphingobium sp.]